MKRWLAISGVWAVAFVVLSATLAHAQYRGSLQGTVTDSQGAVIPGATVTLTDKETNRTLTAETNDAGIYNIGALPPSRYTLSVEKAGFKKKLLQDVGIVAEQANAVNVVLEVGQATEVVTVRGDAEPLLDAETANISGTVTAQEVQTMPAYGRDPFQLVQLAPDRRLRTADQISCRGEISPPGPEAPRREFSPPRTLQPFLSAEADRN